MPNKIGIWHRCGPEQGSDCQWRGIENDVHDVGRQVLSGALWGVRREIGGPRDVRSEA